MLESVQAKIGEFFRLRVREDRDDTALVVEFIGGCELRAKG